MRIRVERKYMYQFKSRVRYSEINSEQQLTLSALLDYLQDCCTFESEELEIGVDYLAREQVAWVLSSWEIQIARYPKMGEEICVGTWPYDFKGFYGYRNFLIKDENGTELVRANSVWVFMDTERMRPIKISDDMVKAYRDKITEGLSGEWGDRKVAVPDGGEKKEPVRVARFHIDTNHHMNNGKYVLVAEELLPENFMVGGLRVEYRKAAVLGDTLYPVVTVGEQSATVVLGGEADEVYAVVQFLRRQ